MRNELELIEKIERYLEGLLPADERAAFEQEIILDPVLKEEVRLQEEIMKGLERSALKKEVRQAQARFTHGRHFTRWGFTGLGVVVIVAAVFYYQSRMEHQPASYEGKTLPQYNEIGGKDWSDADHSLDAQVFRLYAGTDTVIETRGGLVLSVPANGFLDKDGQPATGNVELIVKEALDAASIIRAGLSSCSGDALLESGGMFFLDARKNKETLRINPAQGIYIEVPADTIKPGMQLFSGKRMADRSIDWINPRPMEHDLLPVDIHGLDFYPPHYLDSIRQWGYNAGNRRFTDSLYYSLASFLQASPQREDMPAGARSITSDTSYGPRVHGVRDTVELDRFFCAIDPAKIKVIWSDSFQNTLLATREFEQRMPWIHRSGKAPILDLYVNNLDKDLSVIDSMAAGQLSGEWKQRFLSFSERRDGKVKTGNRSFDSLREYYRRKAQAFAEAISKTQHDFWNKQAKLDSLADEKEFEHQRDSAQRVNQNFAEEFTVNLKEAYRQLGYDTALAIRSWQGSVYNVRVVNTGWCNVDRYVYESAASRTSLQFTDPKSGRDARISYLPVSFRVERFQEYDRLYVYLLPDKLSSFMRLRDSLGVYRERLDEAMKYSLVCIAYKGGQAFFYSQEDVRPKEYASTVLAAIGEKELDRALNRVGSRMQARALGKENDFNLFRLGDQKRQKRNQSLWELTEKVEKFIFPCIVNAK